MFLKRGMAFLAFAGLLFSCNRKQAPATSSRSISYIQLSGVDYADERNWAALPQIEDPSDSVPAPLKPGYVKDHRVDVFFLYPTSYTNASAPEWNAAIEDSAINHKTDYSSILYQASVFNEFDVYAPRYRQANIRAYFTADTISARAALELAYGDVRKAFLYYLDHKNNGRPILIASHSQGTTHAKKLLAEFFDGKPLQKQLVAAYIVGLPVAENAFAQIPVCQDSTQTGCFLTWRTFKKGYEPDYQAAYRQSAVVNPLSWTTDETLASAGMNKGAVLRNFNRLVPQVCSAQKHEDLLWVSRPHFPGSIFYRTKNYHVGDFNLFYLNVRENVRARVQHYFETQVSKN
ncbi:MAG: DUF3089 domain-containing protein [Bacteroidetes bacterium]|nr:DUF3089 domain-containing protein [Bacteroidota bacterium]